MLSIPVSVKITLSTIMMMLLFGVTAYSQIISKKKSKAGEMTVVGTVTINGAAASTGATVFTNSLIKTSKESRVLIDLGKLGRLHLSSDSELVLRFDETIVGGDLASGRVILSSPGNVAVALNTKEGLVSVDGKKPALVTVDVTCGNTRVLANGNAAGIKTRDKMIPVAAGKETSVGNNQSSTRCDALVLEPWGRKLTPRALAAALLGAGGAAAVAGYAASKSGDSSNVKGNSLVSTTSAPIPITPIPVTVLSNSKPDRTK